LTANLIHYSGYEEAELEEIVQDLLIYFGEPCKHESFFKKYSCKKTMRASIFVKEWMKLNHPELLLEAEL
jgi:hypothetical protein